MGKYTNAFDRKLKTIHKRKYARIQLRSFMTGPEWRNVEMANEFAEYLDEGKSLFHFPYFSQISDLWRIVGKSYKAARKYNSHGEIWFSTNYMFMDLFVAFFTTMELLPKALISLMIRRFVPKKYSSEFQDHLATHFKDYAEKLETTPFYDHDYDQALSDLKENYKDSDDKTILDKISYALVSFDLWARKWISKPLHYFLHQGATSDTYDKTDVIVKHRVYDAKSPEAAKQTFMKTLKDEDCGASVVDDPRIEVHAKPIVQPKKKGGHSYVPVYARLRAPRYADFKDSVDALEGQRIYLRKSAGNDRVQIKVEMDAHSAAALQKYKAKAMQICEQSQKKISDNPKKNSEQHRIEYLYSYQDRIHKYRRVCMFDVPVKNLHKTLERFEKISSSDNVKVKFIHNF